MPYRKPRNWIRRLAIRRSESASRHQEAIERLGFGAYCAEHLVLLDDFELGQRLHPGVHMVRGKVRRNIVPPSAVDARAYVEGTD